MSTIRHGQLVGYPRDVDGWPLCRYCGERCPSRRRTFCSDACVHEWQIRSSAAYARAAVNQRDGGVCAGCRRETLPLYERARELFNRLPLSVPFSYSHLPPDHAERLTVAATAAVAAYDAWAEEMRAQGFGTVKPAAWLRDRTSRTFRAPTEGWFWQADHIMPVAEGGGLAGLDNLQTLCTPCHQAKTKAQAGRRKAKPHTLD